MFPSESIDANENRLYDGHVRYIRYTSATGKIHCIDPVFDEYLMYSGSRICNMQLSDRYNVFGVFELYLDVFRRIQKYVQIHVNTKKYRY